jgi:hypothetical protein
MEKCDVWPWKVWFNPVLVKCWEMLFYLFQIECSRIVTLCINFITCLLHYRVCSIHGAAVWWECAPGKGLDHTWVPASLGIQHACWLGASREAAPAILWPRSRCSSLLQERPWRDTANKVRASFIHIHTWFRIRFAVCFLQTIKLKSVCWELVWKSFCDHWVPCVRIQKFSLPCSQKPTAGRYPELVESSSQPLSLKMYFNIMLFYASDVNLLAENKYHEEKHRNFIRC